MNISVVIPTYNGAHRILNTLRALENQAVKNFEVIVIVDGSNDGTVELLEKEVFDFPSFKCIWQTNKGRAGVRNRGANEARGALLIFFDDDMRPAVNSMEKHIVFHRNHQDCIYGGNQQEEDINCKTDIQKYKRHLSLKWISKYHEGLNELKKENLFLTAANFSIPKSIFEKLGGFDESLTDAEDYELGMRALDQGYKVFFDKSNIAWHDEFITCKGYINRQKQYFKANVALTNKIPSQFLRKPLKIHNMRWVKRLMSYIFSSPKLVSLIDNDFFIFLPRAIRFKIYDLTITSIGKINTNKLLG